MANTIKKQRNKYWKDVHLSNVRKEAYTKKMEEFKDMSIEQIQAYFDENKKNLGGVYRMALLDTLQSKLLERQKELKLAEDVASSTEQADNNLQQEQSPESV